MPARAIRIVAIMGIALLAASVAKAAEPAPAGHAGLDDAEISRRIRFLEQRLDDSRTHGQIWYWSWLTINGGSMVGTVPPRRMVLRFSVRHERQRAFDAAHSSAGSSSTWRMRRRRQV